MRLRRKLWIAGTCAVTAAVTVLGAGAGVSGATGRQSHAGQPHLTWAQFYGMSPAGAAAVQNPLLNAAAPAEALGATSMAGIYWGAALDIPDHLVDIIVTDPARAGRLLDAARRLNPGLNLNLIRLRRTTYSLRTLTDAADRLLDASRAKLLPFPLYSVSQLDEGASITLQVPDAAKARLLSQVRLPSLGGRSVAQYAGVRLTFATGHRQTPLSRENDTAPFIAGDFMAGFNDQGNANSCTAGIPAEDSSGEDYLITAGHCFGEYSYVYTMNRSTYIGYVGKWNDNVDAELVDTGLAGGQGSVALEGNNDTSDGGQIGYPIVGNAASPPQGTYLCQDGIQSYEVAGRVPCNMEVHGTDSYTVCYQADDKCATVNAIHTISTNGDWVALSGDSGGLVFTIYQQTQRLAMGMVDSGTCQVAAPRYCSAMNFIYAGTLYARLGVHLNPDD